MSDSLRERALRLLARREYARDELKRRLAPHAESPEALAALLDDLVERDLLSNARYVDMRLHVRGPRFGNARLASELRAAGVEDALVAAAIEGSEDEVTRARAVWQRKFGEGGAPADAVERARQMRFLMNRGFSGETIRRVLRGDFEDE